MIKKFIQFIQSINDNKIKQESYSFHSQIIRNARKEKNLTLEEVSHGISSVSYLSKLERNLLPADPYYVKAFFEKLNLDYHENSEGNVETLEIVIRSYLSGVTEVIKNKYQGVGFESFSSINSLIKCFYLLVIKDYTSFNLEIKKIDRIKEGLPKLEATTFVFLIIKYYEQTHQFKEVAKYIPVIINLEIPNSYLKNLMYNVIINTAYHLSKVSLFNYAYNEINKSSNLYYPVADSVRNKFLFLDTLIKSKDILLEDDTIELYRDENIYYRLLKLYRLEKYYEMYMAINDSTYLKNPDVLCLFGYASYLLKNDDMIKLTKEHLENFDAKQAEKEHILFLKFLELILNDDKEYKVFEFLRKEAIPYSESYQHVLYTEIYEKHYLSFLAKLSRYKEIWIYISNKS